MKRNLDQLWESARNHPITTPSEEVLNSAFEKAISAGKWYQIKTWKIMTSIAFITSISVLLFTIQMENKEIVQAEKTTTVWADSARIASNDSTLKSPPPTPSTAPEVPRQPATPVPPILSEEKLVDVDVYPPPVSPSEIKNSASPNLFQPIDEELEKFKAVALPHVPETDSTKIDSHKLQDPEIPEIPEFEERIVHSSNTSPHCQRCPTPLKTAYKVQFLIDRKADLDALNNTLKQTDHYGTEIQLKNWEIDSEAWKKLQLSFRYKGNGKNGNCYHTLTTGDITLKKGQSYLISWQTTLDRKVHDLERTLLKDSATVPPYQLIAEPLSLPKGDTLSIKLRSEDGKEGLDRYVSALKKMGYEVHIRKASYSKDGHIKRLHIKVKSEQVQQENGKNEREISKYVLNFTSFKSLESLWFEHENGNYSFIRNNANFCDC